jgi:hypothetical protein
VGDLLMILAATLALLVGSWVVIFGGIGCLLSRTRGGSCFSGLAWGVLTGPFGWLVIAWRTRSRSPRQDSVPDTEAVLK